MILSDAEKSITNAWKAAVFLGSITLLVTLISVLGADLGFDLFSFIDVGLIFLLAFGIYKKSRSAALLMLAYYLFNLVFRIATVSSGLALLGQIFVSILFIRYFVLGVRGAFARYKLTQGSFA